MTSDLFKSRCLARERNGTLTWRQISQSWRTGEFTYYVTTAVSKSYWSGENYWYFDRELLEAVRKWEESETTGAKVRQFYLSQDSVEKAQEEQGIGDNIKWNNRLNAHLPRRRSWLPCMMADLPNFSICRSLALLVSVHINSWRTFYLLSSLS